MQISQNLTRTMASLLSRGARSLLRATGALPTTVPNGTVPGGTLPSDTTAQREQDTNHQGTGATNSAPSAIPYPGDWHGDPTTLALHYAATVDDQVDAGEVVWAWVPYEEDHRRGKDRPVLIIGRHGSNFLALQLTSKDHDRDAAQEARAGRHWVDVGAGPWDRRGRQSEVRVDRILQLDPRVIRRQGSALDPEVFSTVARQVRRDW